MTSFSLKVCLAIVVFSLMVATITIGWNIWRFLSNDTADKQSIPANVQARQLKSDAEFVSASTMSPADLELAKRQTYCPVTLLKFINMDVGGIKVNVRGRDVLVATAWAKDNLLSSPDAYLRVIDKWEKERKFNQRIQEAFSGLSIKDQLQARKQAFCFVDNTLLGLKGAPVPVQILPCRINTRVLMQLHTETIFVCCNECKTKALQSPEIHRDLLRRIQSKSKARRYLSSFRLWNIGNSLANLSKQDRALAEEQYVCPVTTVTLGSWGTPVRVSVDETEVLLCCDGCRRKLLADPRRHLNALREYHMKADDLSMPVSLDRNYPFDAICDELPLMEPPVQTLPQLELPE